MSGRSKSRLLELLLKQQEQEAEYKKEHPDSENEIPKGAAARLFGEYIQMKA